MFTRLSRLLGIALLSALSLLAADLTMKVTDAGYLDSQGFSVILYHSTFHPIFESEYVIDVAAKWILAANAADAIVRSGI